jgi:uncharacterized protein YkwD
MTRTRAALIATAVISTSIGCATGTGSVPAQNILDLINQKRATAGCPAVLGDDKLRAAADREAVDMRDHNSYLLPPDGHTGSDGSRPDKRMKDAGFLPLSHSGEIIYWADSDPAQSPNPASAEATVNWWMNSPGHRAIMLDCTFTHAGVGLLYPGGTKWFAVADFGTH